MSSELINITFKSKITPIKPINDAFTLCKCYVMAIGANANQTIITKEEVDKAISTLYNIPVVGHLYIDEDNTIRAGGHDTILEKDKDGIYKFKSLTVPYGTVPQQDNVHYEEVEEDGAKNVYLVADIILWTGRYPELLDAIYSDNIYFAQSMEIIPSDTKQTKNGLEIKSFQFSALCLLGKSDDNLKNVTPCFKSARVEPYKFSDSDNELWTKLFAEFKDQLAKSYSAVNAIEGGEEVLDIKTIKKILIEFGLSEDTKLSFEIPEGMTESDLREKIKDFAKKEIPADKKQKETFEEQVEVKNPVKYEVDLTYKEKRSALESALSDHAACDDTSYIDYYLIDFDDTYVYAYFYHVGLNIKEDTGTIRIPYSFADGKAILEVGNSEVVRNVWLTKSDEEKISAEKAQFEELVKYKADRLQEDKRQSYAAILSDFSDLGEIDEYKALVKEVMSFESAEALSEKLYALRGKNADNIAKKPLGQIRVPIGFEQKSKENEYDEFMSRYLGQKNN